MRKVTLKGLLARKLRLALTALAIVLGVTFVSGTLVLTDTLNRTFDTLIGNAYQHINFQIRGKAAFGDNAAALNGTADRKPVPESLAGVVGHLPGVAARETGRSRATPSSWLGTATPSAMRPRHWGFRSTPTRSCRPCAWSKVAPPQPPMRSSWTRRRRTSTTSRWVTGSRCSRAKRRAPTRSPAS